VKVNKINHATNVNRSRKIEEKQHDRRSTTQKGKGPGRERLYSRKEHYDKKKKGEGLTGERLPYRRLVGLGLDRIGAGAGKKQSREDERGGTAGAAKKTVQKAQVGKKAICPNSNGKRR